MRVETLDYKRDAEFVCGSAVTHGVFKPQLTATLIFGGCQMFNTSDPGMPTVDAMAEAMLRWIGRLGRVDPKMVEWAAPFVVERYFDQPWRLLARDPRFKAAILPGVTDPPDKIIAALIREWHRDAKQDRMRAIAIFHGRNVAQFKASTHDCCEPARQMHEQYLPPGKMPRYPLPGCNVLNCQCFVYASWSIDIAHQVTGASFAAR